MPRVTRELRRRLAIAVVGVVGSLIVITTAASAPQADHNEKPDQEVPPDRRGQERQARHLDPARLARGDDDVAGRRDRGRRERQPRRRAEQGPGRPADDRRRDGAAQAVAAVGGVVEASSSGLVQALVPPTALAPLGQVSAIRYVRAPFHPQVDAVQGEGVAAVGAPAWHALGRTGAGAKVAIIDLGFEGLAASQASGDLPASLTTVDYCGGLSNGEPHGVAVSEIVHEVAPDAELTLICVDSEVTLAQAEDYVEAHGIKIVNHSVSWFNTSRGDGSGAPGTPDATVAAARAAGVLWVNAAGNYAESHWSGTFKDTDGDNFNNYTSGDQGNTFYVPAGGVACVTLKWDSWPTTSQDYDLYLARSSDDALFSWSTNLQNGTQPPTESACFENTTAFDDWFYALIDRFGASATPRFDMFFYGDAYFLQYAQAAGSVTEINASKKKKPGRKTCARKRCAWRYIGEYRSPVSASPRSPR